MKRGLCSALPLRASHNDPLADGSWQGVDEEDQEDDEDEQNEGDDDVLLVVPPDEVVQALEGTHEPREGGVWAAGEEIREGVKLPRNICDTVFLGTHRRSIRIVMKGHSTGYQWSTMIPSWG